MIWSESEFFPSAWRKDYHENVRSYIPMRISNCTWSPQIYLRRVLRSVLLYLGQCSIARHLKPSWERLLGYFSINRANGEWKDRIEKNILQVQLNCKGQWHFQVTHQLFYSNTYTYFALPCNCHPGKIRIFLVENPIGDESLLGNFFF